MGNSQGKQVGASSDLNLNQFRLLRVVGKGAFGKVRIVERKDTGLTFALKYIRKEEVVKSESVRNIIRERRMLEHLNHPFLCNLRYSFQDIEYIYIVVDLMNGGDLRFHISRKCFTEDAIRFWILEMGSALRYIHSQGIIHRDVKPDNILLDSEGHVHLADFNVASDFRPGKPLTSKSGTLAYLAPEVYEGGGYYSEVDWWSLGVTFYECIYNKRPFEGRTQENLSETIKGASPKYFATNPPVSVPCLRAMAALLEKDRSKRIGAVSFESFMSHPFFAEFDFEAVEAKAVPPVFTPSSEKTNFDATYDLEELLLEEAPLEARARRQKPRAELRDDATAKEIREDELHRLIETMFEPFDYTRVTYRGNAADAIASTENPEDCFPLGSDNVAGGPGGAVLTPGPTSGFPSGTTPGASVYSQQQQQLSQPDSNRDSPTSQYELSGSHTNPSTNPAGDDGPPIGEALEHQTSTPSRLPPPSTTPPPPMSSQAHAHAQGQAQAQAHAQALIQAQAFHRPFPPPQDRAYGATRKTSKSGGVQMVLEESGSWSQLADQSSTLPAEGYDHTGAKPKNSNGMLSFFNRRRGRDRSPKPQEPGVLGKEGARQIIGG